MSKCVLIKKNNQVKGNVGWELTLWTSPKGNSLKAVLGGLE